MTERQCGVTCGTSGWELPVDVGITGVCCAMAVELVGSSSIVVEELPRPIILPGTATTWRIPSPRSVRFKQSIGLVHLLVAFGTAVRPHHSYFSFQVFEEED